MKTLYRVTIQWAETTEDVWADDECDAIYQAIDAAGAPGHGPEILTTSQQTFPPLHLADGRDVPVPAGTWGWCPLTDAPDGRQWSTSRIVSAAVRAPAEGLLLADPPLLPIRWGGKTLLGLDLVRLRARRGPRVRNGSVYARCYIARDRRVWIDEHYQALVDDEAAGVRPEIPAAADCICGVRGGQVDAIVAPMRVEEDQR